LLFLPFKFSYRSVYPFRKPFWQWRELRLEFFTSRLDPYRLHSEHGFEIVNNSLDVIHREFLLFDEDRPCCTDRLESGS
jgi:hypothetical protein